MGTKDVNSSVVDLCMIISGLIYGCIWVKAVQDRVRVTSLCLPVAHHGIMGW